MPGGLGGSSLVERVVRDISSVGEVEVFGLIQGFINGQGSLTPVNGWIDFLEPGESEDYVFIFQKYDVEGDLLSDSLNVKEEGEGKADDSSAVNRVVSVLGIDWFIQLSGGEEMFLDKPPIKARDTRATNNKGASVDGFQSVMVQ